MNAKKVCCLFTVTAMLLFGLPAVPFANVDRAPQLSQEELGLVFQNAKNPWKEKPDFLKYLDEQEMKETKGKAAWVVGGAVVGGIGGGIAAWNMGGNVLYGVATGAIGGAYGGLMASGTGLIWAGKALITAGLGTGGGFAAYGGCASACHSVRPQGGH